jgi:hypothetical protein
LDGFLGHFQDGITEKSRKTIGKGDSDDETKNRGKKEGFLNRVKQIHLEDEKDKKKKYKKKRPFPSETQAHSLSSLNR